MSATNPDPCIKKGDCRLLHHLGFLYFVVGIVDNQCASDLVYVKALGYKPRIKKFFEVDLALEYLSCGDFVDINHQMIDLILKPSDLNYEGVRLRINDGTWTGLIAIL